MGQKRKRAKPIDYGADLQVRIDNTIVRHAKETVLKIEAEVMKITKEKLCNEMLKEVVSEFVNKRVDLITAQIAGQIAQRVEMEIQRYRNDIEGLSKRLGYLERSGQTYEDDGKKYLEGED